MAPDSALADTTEASEEERSHDPATMTVFKKLGSWTALHAAVGIFYKKVLGDPLLAPYFEGIPMERLRKKQMLFMAFAFGGASQFFGKQIAHAHRAMILERGLGLTHFDAVAGHFVATLTELGVPGDLIAEAAGVVLTTRPLFDPEIVFAEAAAVAAATNAPLQSSLMTLQAELTPDESPSGRSRAVSTAGASGRSRTVSTAGASAGAREEAEGGASGSAAKNIRISTLAAVFAPQVLGEGRVACFQSLKDSSRTSSAAGSVDTVHMPQFASEPGPGRMQQCTTAERQTPNCSLANALLGPSANEGALMMSKSASTDVHMGQGQAQGTPSERPHAAQASSEPSQDKAVGKVPPGTTQQGDAGRPGSDAGATQEALEAKRLRRAMMKEILKGIGVLPASPSQPTTPSAFSASLSDMGKVTSFSPSGLPSSPAQPNPDAASSGAAVTSSEGLGQQQLLLAAGPSTTSPDCVVGEWLKDFPGPPSENTFGTLVADLTAQCSAFRLPSAKAGDADAGAEAGAGATLDEAALSRSSSTSSSSGVSFMDSDEELQHALTGSRGHGQPRQQRSSTVKRRALTGRTSSRLSQSTDGKVSPSHSQPNSASKLSQMAHHTDLFDTHSSIRLSLDLRSAPASLPDRPGGSVLTSLATLQEVSETVSSAYKSGGDSGEGGIESSHGGSLPDTVSGGRGLVPLPSLEGPAARP